MHYKNGREAKVGDKVMLTRAVAWDNEGKPTAFASQVGILYDAVAGNDHCNGKIAPISFSDTCPDLKECLRLDDALMAIDKTYPPKG